MNVDVLRGRPGQEAVLENLYQLYDHDFSEWLAPDPARKLQDDGRFPLNPYLASYWRDADRSVWFIRVNDALAGFALLSRWSHAALPTEHSLSEFFVARPYRRAGVGVAAFISLLSDHPGRWEVAMLRSNTPALEFWPRALNAAKVVDLETISASGWDGPVLRFRAL